MIGSRLLMAGGEDGIVDTGHQSARLHGVIRQSELRVLPGLGHMLHYFATDQVSVRDLCDSDRQKPTRAAVSAVGLSPTIVNVSPPASVIIVLEPDETIWLCKLA